MGHDINQRTVECWDMGDLQLTNAANITSDFQLIDRLITEIYKDMGTHLGNAATQDTIRPIVLSFHDPPPQWTRRQLTGQADGVFDKKELADHIKLRHVLQVRRLQKPSTWSAAPQQPGLHIQFSHE